MKKCILSHYQLSDKQNVEILKLTEEKQLHIHTNLGACGWDVLTHSMYIMHNADIVWCGGTRNILAFCKRFDPKNYRPLTLLPFGFKP